MRHNLINARQQAKLTQKELGNLLCVSERHINALEAGTSDGSIKIWKQLRELFKMSIDLLEQTNNISPKYK